ncbi:MAG: ribonuclease HII [Erysipelotrichaceae bacterium]|jgi:ribonuclease HII|nr:ribonuclease HII [Erysipelotrichaceae bacterium]
MALDYENKYFEQGYTFIVGTDEAGRGSLLGPVVASAVILPKGFSHPLINDSKKLSEKQREEAFKIIVENALDYKIGIVDAEEIDKINIYEASRLAMTKAIKALKIPFEIILTDAMPLPNINYPYEAIIRGDAKSESIAAASIIAKVTRDKMMVRLDAKYPSYGIKKHKGYPTKEHINALEEYGPIKGIHRYSYAPIKKILTK